MDFLTKENLKQFLTSFFLSENTIYTLLLGFSTEIHSFLNEKVENTYKMVETWGIEDFGINVAFALNENTRVFLKKSSNLPQKRL